MKVLMISSDRKLFEPGSEVQKRIKEYGKLFDELHIIVFSKRNNQIPRDKIQISNNVWVCPTNHKHKILYLWHIYKIAKEIIVSCNLVIGNCVITTQDPFELGLAGWLLKLRYKIPLQIQIHTDIFSPYFSQESFKNKIRVLLARFLLPKADGIRVVSERIKNSLLTLYPIPYTLKSISVLPIFVNVKKIQSAKIKLDLHQKYPEYDFIILMASRLTREKNISLAIEAMKEILTPKPSTLNPLLLIVGDGPELNKLKVKSEKLKVNNNVRFEPWTKDLVSYYKTADLFLLTSNYEGYGRTVVEAMAAGAPVVMTDVGLAGELLVDDLDGAVVPVGHKEFLSRAVSKLIENGGYRRALADESQKIINSLPSKEEYLDLYKNSLNSLIITGKPKLCYFLPEFKKDDHTHFAYLHDFLNEIKKDFDIYLIIEKKQNVFYDFLLLRLIRVASQIKYARFLGYRDFYVHYSFLGAFLASLVTKIFGGRVFYWNCGEPWKYHRGFLRNLFEKSTYRLITFLVTGTGSMAEEYAKHYGIPLDKIKIMPNWINLEKVQDQMSKVNGDELRKELNISPNVKVLLFVHRLSKRKGAQYLPEILKYLNTDNLNGSYHSDKGSRYSDYVLLIIGDGPEKKNIESNVAGQMSKVRLLGWVPQNKVLDYFAIADVFLMPSEEEGFPHVLLESMVAGVPFVATNVGGVKDIIPPSALRYVAESGDVAALSEKTRELLNLRGTPLRSLKQELMQWVRRYDIKKVAEQFSEIILK